MMRRKGRGFTLIELLVVIAIIGLLASVILASLANARKQAKIADARATVRQLRIAIGSLENDSNQWPGHQVVGNTLSGMSGNEIWDLTTTSSGLVGTDGSFPNWRGPYMPVVPLDPWGHPYFFDTDYDINPGGGSTWAAVVGSFGPNGVGQNLYDSDDIVEVLASQ